MKNGRALLFGLLLGVLARGAAADQSQSLEDAWWTGPLLAASPSTLPQGHFLIEPYVFDAIPQGHYDENGTRRTGVAHQNDFGSQSYVLYGLIDTVSVGLIPRFAFNDPSQGRSSSGVDVGDLTLQGQYRLTQFRPGGWTPTTAIVLGETVPTGKYDRLGDRPADGVGSGAYTTIVSLYSQYYFWLPTGRILRTRFDVSYSFSGSASVHDVSVYGTEEGFRGRAYPGDSIVVDGAFEYSLTHNWVLSFDVAYEHDASTRVNGVSLQNAPVGTVSLPVQSSSPAGQTWSLAPALEYNFNSRVGIIAGAKMTVAGRNATAEIIPVAAVNIVI